MFKPTQILTAEHWFAAFEKEGEDPISIPLVCWALGEDDEADKGWAINGMIVDDDGAIIPANTMEYFVGYEMESQDYDVVTDVLN